MARRRWAIGLTTLAATAVAAAALASLGSDEPSDDVPTKLVGEPAVFRLTGYEGTVTNTDARYVVIFKLNRDPVVKIDPIAKDRTNTAAASGSSVTAWGSTVRPRASAAAGTALLESSRLRATTIQDPRSRGWTGYRSGAASRWRCGRSRRHRRPTGSWAAGCTFVTRASSPAITGCRTGISVNATSRSGTRSAAASPSTSCRSNRWWCRPTSP